MKSNYHDIIIAPVITEKTANLSADNVYVFSVKTSANKTHVKQAIEALFNVKVTKVNILNVKPKKKRVGKYPGLTNRERRAFVTVAEGNKIELN